MATKTDRIRAVRAYLTSHLDNLGDLTDEASRDGTMHYFRIGHDYTLVLSRDLLGLEAESVVETLRAHRVGRRIQDDGKGYLLAVKSDGRTTRYTHEEWQRLHPS